MHARTRALTMEESKHVYISSSDSLQYFPHNTGAHFRVKLGEALKFTGSWVVSLTGINIIVKEADIGNVLDAQNVHIYSNLVGLSIVGGHKRQLLRIVNLGRPIVRSNQRTVYHVDPVENSCFYKPVIAQECSYIEVELKHDSLYILDLLNDSKVCIYLHFKRTGVSHGH